jgi:hypothetical protein
MKGRRETVVAVAAYGLNCAFWPMEKCSIPMAILQKIPKPMKRFAAAIWQELPKTLLQAILALAVAWLGYEFGFWGQIRGENYRQRVEAVASLAGTGAELPQRVTNYFVARINAIHATAAANRFNCEPCREERSSWYLRSDEILREIAHSKSEFQKSLSRVRILFPNNPRLTPLLEKIDTTIASHLSDETAKASNQQELDTIREKNIADAARNVDETIGKTVNELVQSLELELTKQGHGRN